jgi:hypothetical protein
MTKQVCKVSAVVPVSVYDKFSELAAAAGCYETSGRNAGTPSIGAVIRDVACGRVHLAFRGASAAPPVEREDKKSGKKERKKFKFWPTSPPKWWADEALSCGAMPVETVVAKTKIGADELVDLGFSLSRPNGALCRAPWPAYSPREIPAWWWDQDSGGGMPVKDAIEASGLTQDELFALGFERLGPDLVFGEEKGGEG